MIGKESSIAVIGAGAIGGITAGFLAKEGYNVEIACHSQELADKIKSSGLHIFGLNGKHRIPVPAVAKISQLSGPKDIVLLATKATDVLAAARELLPFLTDTSIVVSMQNGICEYAIADIVGKNRTIGCIINWGATMHSPGEIEMTSTAGLIIGNINKEPDERLEPLQKILGAVAPTRISQNMIGDLYAKLVINSCITLTGAICGLRLGEMLSIKKLRNIAIEIIREDIDVARKMHVKVEAFAGTLDYYRFLRGEGSFDNSRRHMIIRMIGFKFRRLKSSSLSAVERGKPTEVDYLNGYIADNGKEYDVPTPVNDKIIELVKEIEAGSRQISLSNFDDPFFDIF